MKYLLPFLLVVYVTAGEMSFTEALQRAEDHAAVTQIIKKESETLDKTKDLYIKGSAPEIEIGTENLGISEFEVVVSKELRHSAKITPITRELELRKMRSNLALRPALLSLHEGVAGSYISLAVLSSSIDKIDSILSSLEEEKEIIEKRIRVGAASELELLEHENLIIDMQEERLVLEGDARIAEKQLLRYWDGNSNPQVMSLEELQSFFSVKQVSSISDEHPALAGFAVDKYESELLLAQGEASQKPDFTLTSGFKRANESNENAFILGLSVGLSTKNESKIAKAEAELIKSRIALEKKSVLRELEAELALFDEEVKKSEALLETLHNKRIPLAYKLIDVAEKRYKKGALSIYEKIRYRRELYSLELREIALIGEILEKRSSQIVFTGTLLN